VNVLTFESMGLSNHDASQLSVVDRDSWSAMTLQEENILVIILNPAHALTRQRNDLMHELAHIQLEHKPARVEVSKIGMMLLSDYSEEQEQEADWLAGTLLLPRDGLWQMRSQAKSVSEIGSFYGVSDALTEWRIRMTGVDTQLQRSRRI
jgi:Zn-dependent peptidase ImmA (M78 family)